MTKPTKKEVLLKEFEDKFKIGWEFASFQEVRDFFSLASDILVAADREEVAREVETLLKYMPSPTEYDQLTASGAE